MDGNSREKAPRLKVTFIDCILMVKFKPTLLFIIITSWQFLLPINLLAEMVSIAKDNVNMRTGPGVKYNVQWKIGRGYPLIVEQKKGNWLKVRDFEDDQGWVFAPLTSRKPHFVVKKNSINIRSGPGLKYKVVSEAKHGVVFQTLAKQAGRKGWVKVRHANTGVVGWVRRDLLWGW